MSNALQDKICVVTGATRGIGRGCAVALAEKGATVFVTAEAMAMANSPFKGLSPLSKPLAERGSALKSTMGLIAR